jgi:hypothetical protein
MDGIEDIMLSEVCPAQKDKHCMISLISWTHTNREWNGGFQRLRLGSGEMLVKRHKILVTWEE